jgi:hypothetical protein
MPTAKNINWDTYFQHVEKEFIKLRPASRYLEEFDLTSKPVQRKKPATESEIHRLEKRIGYAIPTSLRNFLLFSNGITLPAFPIHDIYPCTKIQLFSKDKDNEGWIREAMEGLPVTDAEYFVYGKKQDPEKIRLEYLLSCLQLSVCSEPYLLDVFLLNPKIKTKKGEYEIWYHSVKPVFCARRYQSFDEALSSEIDLYLDMLRNIMKTNRL